MHVVAQGETLSRIARLYKKPMSEIAKANRIEVSARPSIGHCLVIRGVARHPRIRNQSDGLGGEAAPSTTSKGAEPVPSASVYARSPNRHLPRLEVAEGSRCATKIPLARERPVIAASGPTTQGQQNDGINIALPENTPVKAAEEGVVAYAGSELKGYGNLVLVRHPNGYVTAYAHAKELLVKRGDQVKRGQVIARSGQSGNVNAPQLHFEVRKGASPLDPIKFLNGA